MEGVKFVIYLFIVHFHLSSPSLSSSPSLLLPLRREHLSPEQIKRFEELSKRVESGDITKELEKEVLVMTTALDHTLSIT